MKKENKNNHDTNHNDYDIPHRNGGEKFFSIIMSAILLGIVVFYISLPIQALTYNSKNNNGKDENSNLVVDNGTKDEDKNEDKTDEPVVDKTPETDDLEKPVTDEKPTTDETPDADDTTNSDEKYDKYAVITYDGLNVRKDTTSNSEAIGQAPLNAKLPILEEYSEYTWVKVLFNGQVGYVHTDFVEYVTE